MKKFGKPHQFIVFSLLSVLLIIAPLLSSSLRTPYLYIVTNLVVIALGAQAGLLSASSNPSDHDRRDGGAVSCAHKPVIPFELACDKKVVAKHDEDKKVVLEPSEKMANVIEKSLSEKIVNTVKVECVRKCPSMPSLFFIGGGDIDHGDGEVIDQDTREVEEEEEEEEEVGELSGQELFTKAETFIGNFYKQLKMQREDSWKKIHEFYHKAF